MSSSEKPVEPPKSQHLDSEDTQKIESEPTKIQIPANGEDQEVGLVPNYNKNIPLSLLYLQFASLGMLSFSSPFLDSRLVSPLLYKNEIFNFNDSDPVENQCLWLLVK